MEFDFLPNLPKSNLDDRSFKELVDECILRIPRYCPEWTNYNPSDPGITLIELFAWLTDQMLMRFNQIPRRNYVSFLELLGIRLTPPAPARSAITFYLSADLPTVYEIPMGVEVATERTEGDEAIAFSTDRPLLIGVPEIAHLLTGDTAELIPEDLSNRFSNYWNRQSNGRWEGREQAVFNDRPLPGNCFYVVFDPEQPLEGNVIALSLVGEAATSTGIDPTRPPRRWEAWDGDEWQPVLLQESDDLSRGFSFYEIGDGTSDVQEADVIVHLPQLLPISTFSSYRGRWLRCVCLGPEGNQPNYSSSPRLIGIDARSIGGTVNSSQCSLIRDELLGESNGLPGQSFQLQGRPILPRQEGEHLVVIPPDGLPQIWTEVSDFADSGPDDRHYTLDSIGGELQFGPLIREPGQLRESIYHRARTQAQEKSASREMAPMLLTPQKRHYGAVPPRGAVLRMMAYRTGGGRQGNVQKHTLQVVKTAVPYVSAVTNHVPALHGADAESLEEAVLRVPRVLRTRDRAVTPEDFEALAIQAGRGAVARSLCPKLDGDRHDAGIVKVIVVPQANTDGLEQGVGIPPQQFELTPQLHKQLLSYLDERRLLGIQVQLDEPEYVGVAVQTEVTLDPEFATTQAQQTILHNLNVALYNFLNPLTGGRDGRGWPFGTSLYPSDIITLLQGSPGVRHLGTVLLFELRRQGDSWVRVLAPGNVVNPGPYGLLCSWADRQLRSAHTIGLAG